YLLLHYVPSVLLCDFQHLLRKPGAFRHMLDGVSLSYQVTSLFQGPASTGVDPADNHLTRLAPFLGPAESCTACQGSTSEI
ncbi:hypothetical protein, partial [Frankia sp. CcWB3]